MKTNSQELIILIALPLMFAFFPLNAIAQLKDNYRVLKDVSFGPDNQQGMDIYLSEKVDGLADDLTIVFLHGGGFYYSDKTKEERYIQPYLEKGFNVVNLNYRLRRGISTAMEDLTIALNYLQENNSEYELNLNKVVVTGFSAGAHIATIVGLSQNNAEYPFTLNKDISIVGIINFSGPVDGLDVIERIFMEHKAEGARKLGLALFPETEGYAPAETVKIYEPISYFDENDPAIFLWHGGKDDQVPPKTFKSFVSGLNSNPNKNVVVFDAEAGHSPSNELLLSTYEKVFEFLNKL